MNYSTYLGIDISKNTLDACLFDGTVVIKRLQIKNTIKNITQMFDLLETQDIPLKEVLICAEHTGPYSYPLIQVIKERHLHFWIENPAEIKQRSGVQRGKNDIVDAERIAKYAYRFRDQAELYRIEDPAIEELTFLTRERESLVIDRAKYLAQLKDQEGFIRSDLYLQKKKRLKRLIHRLSLEINQIETQIDQLLRNTHHLNHQYRLLLSVDGVGKQVALQTLIATKGFTRFKNPRKFSCHAGVAPFSYTSGTSQRSKSKVSHRANKKLKTILHMAALSAVRMKGEFRDYFLRKVAEGKNKMTVINAVRSKIIHRMFAVIRNNTKYDKNYINTLDLSIR